LLGAGFSKAVADGPLMKEIWSCMQNAYEQEKAKSKGQGVKVNYGFGYNDKKEVLI